MARRNPEQDNPLLDDPDFRLCRAASSLFTELTRHIEPLATGVTDASILFSIERNPDFSRAEFGYKN